MSDSWPEVTTAYNLWQEETTSDIVPFATGSNKLFLCRRAFATAYRDALKTPFLNHYFGKTYRTEHAEVDSYRIELVEQDETPVRQTLKLMLKIFRPDLYVALSAKISRN